MKTTSEESDEEMQILNKKVDSLLEKIQDLQEKIWESGHDYLILDIDTLPGKNLLSMQDIQDIKKGSTVYVIAPQDYSGVFALDRGNVSEWSFFDCEDEWGFFDREDGLACTGTHHDMWIKVDAGFDDELEMMIIWYETFEKVEELN